jgi:hypothetical protein
MEAMMKDQEFDERELRYLVCKMLTWDKIEITLADGRTQRLHRPEGEKVIGFVPVYEDHEAAIEEANGLDVIALMTGPVGEFVKGGANADDTES